MFRKHKNAVFVVCTRTKKYGRIEPIPCIGKKAKTEIRMQQCKNAKLLQYKHLKVHYMQKCKNAAMQNYTNANARPVSNCLHGSLQFAEQACTALIHSTACNLTDDCFFPGSTFFHQLVSRGSQNRCLLCQAFWTKPKMTSAKAVFILQRRVPHPQLKVAKIHNMGASICSEKILNDTILRPFI